MKKVIKSLISITLVLILILAVSGTAFASPPTGAIYKTTVNTNLRVAPNLSATIIKTMPTGASFYVQYPIPSSNGFYYGYNSPHYGWAASSCLSFSQYLYG